MKEKLRIISITLLIGGLLAYIGFAAMYYPQKNAEKHCTAMRVSVMDSAQIQFITRADIEQFIKYAGLCCVGKRMDSIDLRQIEKKLQEIPFVKRSETYKTHSGVLRIDVWQRKPLFRVMSGSRQFYVYIKDKSEVKEGELPFGTMPTVYRSVHSNNRENSLSKPFFVPIATGHISQDFLPDLFDFMLFLQENLFWKPLIEQVNVTAKQEIELVSKIGSPIIILGRLNDFEIKLEKLKIMYEQGLHKINWEQYSHINLKYKDQVIGVKKTLRDAQRPAAEASVSEHSQTVETAD